MKKKLIQTNLLKKSNKSIELFFVSSNKCMSITGFELLSRGEKTSCIVHTHTQRGNVKKTVKKHHHSEPKYTWYDNNWNKPKWNGVNITHTVVFPLFSLSFSIFPLPSFSFFLSLLRWHDNFFLFHRQQYKRTAYWR